MINSIFTYIDNPCAQLNLIDYSVLGLGWIAVLVVAVWVMMAKDNKEAK